MPGLDIADLDARAAPISADESRPDSAVQEYSYTKKTAFFLQTFDHLFRTFSCS